MSSQASIAQKRLEGVLSQTGEFQSKTRFKLNVSEIYKYLTFDPDLQVWTESKRHTVQTGTSTGVLEVQFSCSIN